MSDHFNNLVKVVVLKKKAYTHSFMGYTDHSKHMHTKLKTYGPLYYMVVWLKV